MKYIFAYYRISPTPRKNSPEENQKKAIRDYCIEKNFEIAREFEDLLISGKEMDRPAFNEMNYALSVRKDIDGIIIYDVSRFGRNAKEAVPLFMNILNMNKTITLVKNNKTLDFSESSEMSIWELLVPVIEFFQAEEYIKNLHLKQKIGIKRYIEKNGSWGPKKKEVNWKQYDYWRSIGVPNTAICKMLKPPMSIATLNRRLKERE